MEYVYAAIRSVPTKVAKIRASDMVVVLTTPNIGDSITTITEDEKYVYVGGGGSARKMRKIDKQTMAIVDEAPDYIGHIYASLIIGEYLYIAGGARRVWKIKTSDMSKVAESDLYIGSYIRNLVYDSSYIYYCGNSRLVKLNKDNLTTIIQSSYNINTYRLECDDNYLYTSFGGIRKISKDTLAIVASGSENYGTSHAMTSDSDYIYPSNVPRRSVMKVRKSDLISVGESAEYCPVVYGKYVLALTGKDNYIYVGGDTTHTVWKIEKATMLKVSESIDLLGAIYGLTIYPFDIPKPNKVLSISKNNKVLQGGSEWF